PRTLVPLDAETIRSSVQKTGRLVIADEAGPTAGFSAEVAAVATEDAATFARLKAPVKRVCALQVPIPYSPVLEDHVFPDRVRIIAGLRAVLEARKPAAAAESQDPTMCRNIRTLFNFEPPATEEEIRASALQFVRKLSGFTNPSQATEPAFRRAVDEVSEAARRLLESLETASPTKNREIEAMKARARAKERFA